VNPLNPSISTSQHLNNSTKYIFITVDVEDWFQVENLRPAFPIEKWDSCELRVELNTHALLDLFDRHHVQATFFVLGWIAERFPKLVSEIQKRGHEVASHGFNHELCSGLVCSTLREDLQRSKSLLEDITGRNIFGYRAPSFSMTHDLIETLGELGFRYDSSYNNFSMNKRHGQTNGFFQPSQSDQLVARNGIVELPISNLSIGGQTIPWGGGGYFRLYPPLLFTSGVARILKDKGYYNFYCHPWELDPRQPRSNGIGALSRFRHYLNLHKTLERLDHFLSRFKNCNFISCSQYLNIDRH
jgi:polysaccharide deacetylase family protein (PEP-CTERM system associated)